MVNTKKGPRNQQKSYYDKNAVNDNVNQYYESFYQEVENEGTKVQGFSSNVEASEEFKEPMGKPERKRKSRFDQVDQPPS
jgi:hypothetical protein